MSQPDPVNPRVDPAVDPIQALLEICGLAATFPEAIPPAPEPGTHLDLVLRTIACAN